MRATPLAIADVVLIEPDVLGDHRGFFMETWNARAFAEFGIGQPFVQDNHSKSALGTLRGLHYQIPRPQGKLVRVAAGAVFDVAVDLRRRSASFGRWVGTALSAENKRMLWIPPGFAHGFYVTTETAEFLYKCTEFYLPDQECCIRWDDPDLAIDWPLVDDRPPELSEKDAAAGAFGDAEPYP